MRREWNGDSLGHYTCTATKTKTRYSYFEGDIYKPEAVPLLSNFLTATFSLAHFAQLLSCTSPPPPYLPRMQALLRGARAVGTATSSPSASVLSTATARAVLPGVALMLASLGSAKVPTIEGRGGRGSRTAPIDVHTDFCRSSRTRWLACSPPPPPRPESVFRCVDIIFSICFAETAGARKHMNMPVLASFRLFDGISCTKSHFVLSQSHFFTRLIFQGIHTRDRSNASVFRLHVLLFFCRPAFRVFFVSFLFSSLSVSIAPALSALACFPLLS